MKKYFNILDLALPYLYKPWDLEKFRAPSLYSLWDLEKIPDSPPLYGPWGLGKIPRPSFLLGSETWKNFDLHLYFYIGLYGDWLWDLEKF